MLKAGSIDKIDYTFLACSPRRKATPKQENLCRNLDETSGIVFFEAHLPILPLTPGPPTQLILGRYNNYHDYNDPFTKKGLTHARLVKYKYRLLALDCFWIDFDAR